MLRTTGPRSFIIPVLGKIVLCLNADYITKYIDVFVENCEKLLHCKGFSHYQCICNNNYNFKMSVSNNGH